MQIYLPIAEMSVNALLVLAMGVGVGFLSGLFGVGGGFLMTPLLIFLGVPPAVTVGTQANQLVAASVSGVIIQWRRRHVDVKMGMVMLAGSMVGTLAGVYLLRLLARFGQIDLTISLIYVVILGTMGVSMLGESVATLLKRRRGPIRRKLHQHTWLHGLPLKVRFHRSRLYISALLPAGIGVIGGILVAVMGTGGGFVLVPAMIYLLGMPTALVAGTSLFQIIFTTAVTTILQAWVNGAVDIVLAGLLLAGGVVGVQFGTQLGARLRGDHARLIMALLLVGVAARLAVTLVAPPDRLFWIDQGAR